MESERNSGGGPFGRGPQAADSGLDLLFAPGDRPAVDDLGELFGANAPGGAPARISARLDAEGWLELLASGLTFEMSGLAPATPSAPTAAEHFYGLPPDMSAFDLEGVGLRPGAHIAAGGALLPVVRTMLAIAANLALHLPVKVVCWRPAACWMDARYFARVTLTWLSGGAFPALGLTALRRRDDGLFASSGLAFFVGQELLLEPPPGEPAAETVKLGGRVIDHILRHGAVQETQTLPGPSGERLVLELQGDREVRVRRLA